jgi:hypothetical protein
LGFVIILTTAKIIPDYIKYIIGGITIASPFIGLFLAGAGQVYQYKISRYRNNIREYRTRKLFQQVIVLCDSNDLKTAIDVYNSIPKGYLKDFLYAYIIGLSRYCDDEKINARGTEILKNVIENYLPEKIVL